MCKRYTKISKLLTNIHAGFVTALLGCVLTFAPLNAMAATVTATQCNVTNTYATTGVINCSGTKINMSVNARCSTSQTVNTCLTNTSTGATYYITHCSCDDSSATQQQITTQACGTITINFPVCDNGGGGSGGTTTCTPTNYFGTDTPDNSAKLLNCSVISKKRFGGVVVGSCTTCSGSMSLQSATHEVDGCSNLYEFNTCPCTTAAQCGNGTTGTSNNMNITYSASCITATKKCTAKTAKSCKCVKNYYGNVSASSGSCTGTCTACPTDPKNGKAGETSSNGATAITSCYIPSTDASGNPTKFTDDIGSGTYSGACYY